MTIGVSAINISTDMPADTGNIGTEIIWRMCQQHPEHSFLLFFDRPVPAHLVLPANATAVVVPLKAPSLWRRKWWLQWQLPRALKQHRPDVFLAMDGLLPLRSRIPAFLFLKDLSFLQSVAGVPVKWQQFLQQQTSKYITRAQGIWVLSPRQEQELLQYAPAAAGKTSVLPAGIHESYHPLPWEEREAVKQQHTGGVEYFIVTAAMHPRNNIQPLLKAFSALKRRLRSNMKLVLVGNVTPAGQEIADSLRNYKFRDDIVWIQHADQATLAQLTAAAYAMIYTTRFDAVALPVYAALRCEVPVVAIDSEAAREAGKDAVLYTDPENLADLADKLCLMYKDEQLRARLLRNIATVELPGGWDTAAEQCANMLMC
ncbi:glycosyltransferase family 4 protein [Chitinophaga agrisoli]|uniref:Glycosyltransferase family 4 protein n=1 Tax=Chitinophaga agrisoli TaxID=2607653 RepID=A0A5B2W1S7_9BACT|nr:glycosyltransferase [Chitinophaga agrisoli]KAA2245295.1 glycosyltransferase family 4 protein [Chitinophaga agrisoli]